MRRFLTTAWQTIKGFSLTVLVFGLLAATGYAFVVEGEQREIATLQNRLDHMQRDVDLAREKNRQLKARIKRMHASDELSEKIAREDSGLIKEGELLYIFPH